MIKNVYLLRIAIHFVKAIDAQNVDNNHQFSNCPVGMTSSVLLLQSRLQARGTQQKLKLREIAGLNSTCCIDSHHNSCKRDTSWGPGDLYSQIHSF